MSTIADLPDETAAGPQPTGWGRSAISALAAAAVVTIVLLAFLWPTATSKVKDIPVGVVASQEKYDEFVERATKAADEQDADLPYDFTRFDTRADAEQAIRERDSYGAFVLPAQPTQRLEVLTAKAASPAVANMLSSTGSAMVSGGARAGIAEAQHQLEEQQSQQPGAEQKQPGQQTPDGKQGQQSPDGKQGQQPGAPGAEQMKQAQVKQEQMLGQLDQALQGPKVTDLVPLSDDDPQGTGLAVAALPLTIGGMIGGMLISNTVRGTWRRFLSVGLYATVGGLIMVGVLDTWFGFAPAPTLELWGAIALSLASTVGLIVGLHSMIGAPGLGLGAAITLLIGNPLSSAQAPREFLPGPFGEIGQYFVPGATGTLVRDLSYFPDASLLHPSLVLAGWVTLGALFTIIGHHRTGGHGHRAGAPSRRRAHRAEPASA